MKLLTTKLLLAGALFATPALMQAEKPFTVTRVFTGPDGLSHAEEVEVKFPGGTPVNRAAEMVKASGAEIHRIPAGNVQDWHAAPRRQYVITLSGHGELEMAGGQKVQVGPGHVLLVEDTTGKGHITRVVGKEDRVTIQIPLN